MQNKCVCKSINFVISNNKCVKKCSLQTNKVPDGDENCICADGYFLNSSDQTCKKCSTTYSNTEGDGNQKCRCTKGYKDTSQIPSSITCIPCSTFDSNSEAGYVLGCQCRQGYELDAFTDKCIDSCLKNGFDEHYDVVLKKCVCNLGYVNLTGMCQDKCKFEKNSWQNSSGEC